MRRLIALLTGTLVAAALAAAPSPANAAAAGWRVLDAPALVPTAELRLVSASAPGDVWVHGVEALRCGPGCSVPTGNPVLRQWTGTAWRDHKPPAVDLHTVTALEAAAPDDVWVAGGTPYAPFVTHWNGAGWERPEFAFQHPGAFPAVEAGPDGVWVAVNGVNGGAVVHRRAGGRWESSAVPGVRVHRIVARTATDVWALAAPAGVHTDGWGAFLLRSTDGRAWSRVDVPGAPGKDIRLTSVAPRGAADVVVSGEAVGGDGTRVPLFKRWDGAAWADLPDPQRLGGARRLSADRDGVLWDVAGGSVLAYRDGAWTSTPAPRSGTTQEVRLLSLAVVPGASAVYVAGGGKGHLLTGAYLAAGG
ncbi:hypothetical protein [Bailinhaonella thermotolerans]|nr:hypothetical protein [Bailinhaonella thermotolerans]